jgi:hypothetical protein
MSISASIPFLARARSRVVSAVALFLTQPVTGGASPIRDARSLSAVLRHGDVLLTEGNTRAAALVKRLTGSTWSHVSMYVGPLDEGPNPRCIVEADVVAGVRSIRLSELEMLNVRVLRPIALDDTDRGRLAEWVVSRIGGEYDLRHALWLARSLLPAPPKADPASASTGIAGSAERFICSSLLASAFALVGFPVPPTRAAPMATHAADYRYVIPSDFASASGFEVIAQDC